MAVLEKKSVHTLVSEFEKWNEETVDVSIYLLEVNDKKDGSASILFSLAGEHEFILHCPNGYPQNEDRFVVEASANMQSWANALNEFLLDSPVAPQLCNILNKAIYLYCSSSNDVEFHQASSEDETLEEEEDCSEGISLTDDEAAFTTEWELKLARIKKRWLVKEEQMREEMKKSRVSPESDDNIALDKLNNDKSHAKQIFSNSASSGILTNDLVAIMEKEKCNGISAEPIDDNIYNWSVRLSNFQRDCELGQDLFAIQEKFGYNYIELQLEFTMDLYPFYPPLVKVVRPRLQSAMMQRVTSMELVKLSHWNPARDMLSILKEIKIFLQQWARLDIHTRRNDVNAYPQGAYIELEHDLLRLSMVSEVYPRANCKYTIPSDLLPNAQLFVETKSELKTKDYWAAGTGFGSTYTKRQGWDVSAYLAAKELKDQQIVSVLQKILLELKRYNGGESLMGEETQLQNGNCSEVSMELNSPTSSRDDMDTSASQDQLSGYATSMDTTEPCSSTTSCDRELYDILEGSALIPFLESHLRASSFLEICQHSLLYGTLVDVIKEIARQPLLLSLLGSLPHQEKSILDYLLQLKEQATQLLTRIGKASANGSIPQLQKTTPTAPIPAAASEEKVAREFATLHLEVSTRMRESLVQCSGNSPTSSTACTAVPHQDPDEVLYQRCLQSLQFQNYSFAMEGSSAHFYARAFTKANTPSSAQVFRIAQELSSLSTSLPLNLSSSIFVRTDEDKCTLLRVIITGPEGTPYSGGCYLFDIYFPEKYPAVPPTVQLKTTGNGTVRFNPNLYACGKVCLSLLGTWEGQQGEKWNETSTVLQVLVSIQSLILVPDPYFNEPGYETKIGTDFGKKHSELYNEDIRVNNIKWAMIEQLTNPTAGFEDVIRLHFFLKKKKILQEVNCWVRSSGSAKLQKIVQSLEKELCKLQLSTELQDIVQAACDN